MSTIVGNRLGVCSWSLQATSPEELADAVRQCGIGKVQLSLNPLFEEGGAWSEAGQILDDAGLEIVSGMFGCVGEDYSTLESIRQTGGLMLDADWDANRRVAERALERAAGMGVRMITTHAGFIPHSEGDPDYEKMLGRVTTIADIYAKAGTDLLLETGQETAENLERFLAAANRPNLGVNFDPANMILYDKGDPIVSLRRLLPHVRQVHIKDAVRTRTPGTWGEEVRAGAGQVDWAAFLDTLNGGGFTGNLIIEREAGNARLDDVRAARELVLRLTGVAEVA